MCACPIGKKQYDELGERQQQRQRAEIREAFKDFSQHLPLKGLELVSLKLRTTIDHQLVNVEIQRNQ